MRRLVSMILFFMAASSHAASIQVANSHINEQYDGTQLVFDFDAKPVFNGFLLETPPRFVIDVKNARLNLSPAQLNRLRSNDVLKVRTGVKNGTDLRIVMDLSSKIRAQTTLVQRNGYHLVVDFFRNKVQRATYIGEVAKPKIVKPGGKNNVENALALVSPQHSQTAKSSVEKAPVEQRLIPQKNTLQAAATRNGNSKNQENTPTIKLASLDNTAGNTNTRKKPPVVAKPAPALPVAVPETANVRELLPTPVPNAQRGPVVVAIDAGHGGKDPGARGPRGTQEKEVTMKIAKQLQRLVNQQKGMKACLTRSKDVYLKLYKRIDIARTQCKADIFVSIHADAFYEPDPQGASVFVLSTKGASSAMARWLAKTENKADAIGGSLSIKDKKLRKVVLDMVQDASLVESQTLAQNVLQQLGKVGKLHSRKVERAGFAVLKSPEMPSILVETAFISNPKEEQKLRDHRYQQKLAQAILGGILEYTRQRPQLTQSQPIVASR